MAINSTSMALGMVAAEKEGLERSEAVRVGVIASMLGTPVMAFVMAQAMARRKAEEQAASVVVVDSKPSDEKPPQEVPPDGTSSGHDKPATLEEVGLVAAEAALQASEAHKAAHEADRSADRAHLAANRNHKVLQELKVSVNKGFKDIQKQIGSPKPPSRRSARKDEGAPAAE